TVDFDMPSIRARSLMVTGFLSMRKALQSRESKSRVPVPGNGPGKIILQPGLNVTINFEIC
ncbi:MAG TPA: hypothetical protein VGD31_19055, partial [Sphingobacteriaceae bacterium]